MGGMTYAGVGIVYEKMDPFKIAAQQAARSTGKNLKRHGLQEMEWTRGESVYLFFDPKRQCYWGHVHEGLGTKNRVCDAMASRHGNRYYRALAQCTLAMAFNDAATLGVRPVTSAMHVAAGSSDWFKDEERTQALIEGWAAACDVVGCTWAGGETPTLRDIVNPDTVELSCSMMGLIDNPSDLIRGYIEPGDRIILLRSSGVHANGLTLARDVAAKMPEGYFENLASGNCYGVDLLQPTVLYGPVVEACQDAGLTIHYGVHITGHGYRKLMRLAMPMRYVLDKLPTPQPVFQAIQHYGEVSMNEMYGNYNMGAGFALYVPPADAKGVVAIAEDLGIEALDAGYLEPAEESSVILRPVDLEFTRETLAVR